MMTHDHYKLLMRLYSKTGRSIKTDEFAKWRISLIEHPRVVLVHKSWRWSVGLNSFPMRLCGARWYVATQWNVDHQVFTTRFYGDREAYRDDLVEAMLRI